MSDKLFNQVLTNSVAWQLTMRLESLSPGRQAESSCRLQPCGDADIAGQWMWGRHSDVGDRWREDADSPAPHTQRYRQIRSTASWQDNGQFNNLTDRTSKRPVHINTFAEWFSFFFWNFT